jgi:hypothetical protein
MTTKEKVKQLVSDISYQINRPKVTTMGFCANKECSGVSRGGATCEACLIKELGAIVGTNLVIEWILAAKRSRILFNRIIEKSSKKQKNEINHP